MKRSLFILVALVAFFATEAQARFRIPVGEHQKMTKVATLPDEYENNEGVHVDLGCMYTVFEIAYIPVWMVDKGEIVCFTEEEKDTYYALDPEIRSSIQTDLKVDDLDSLISIPFWDAWGGKLIVLVILLLIILYRKGKKKMEEQNQTQTQEAES